MLHSNQQIGKVYATGESPVLVECTDLKDYVCKHNNGQSIAYRLFAEWISYGLLDRLGVELAPRELVTIKAEHIVPSGVCQPRFFKVPCFATESLQDAVEWSQFKLPKPNQYKNLEDLIVIAFFDIWIGNDDRSWGNFNLLSHPVESGWVIIPIDHGACLNTQSFSVDRPLTLQTETDTLIHTEHFRTLVKPKLKTMKEASDFIESLYLRILDLEQQYDDETLAIPQEWNIPSEYMQALKEQLFSKAWLDETKKQFLTFIKSSLHIK